jgi:DNA processing protein
MTLDAAVALSLLEDLPRTGLTARLASGDPTLLELARPRLDDAATVRRAAEAAGTRVVVWDDADFPAPLRAIPDCPPALWYRGTLEAFDAPMVAVVGSRSASAASLDIAARLAEGLAGMGITVVSGLARGVDSAAHRGALRCGRTIAVLGSGLDRLYPAEHRPLAQAIAERGLVLSEYPPHRPALPFHFPLRNRLISGLSAATVVVEAAEKSGSLITAGYALEQGREVMAVPGVVAGGRNRGGHALIRDGAALVETAEDVLQQLGWACPGAPSRAATGRTGPETDPVLRNMREGEVCSVEQLAADTGLGPARLLQRLAELELGGLVRRLAGGRFVRQS